MMRNEANTADAAAEIIEAHEARIAELEKEIAEARRLIRMANSIFSEGSEPDARWEERRDDWLARNGGE